LSSVPIQHQRVLSGMRPTGALHLGHYHGVLKNWVNLQHEYECFFFVADWHALTTQYENPAVISESTLDMVIDWLASGVAFYTVTGARACRIASATFNDNPIELAGAGADL